MNARSLLTAARDIVTLVIGAGGVIHEEFYTTQERPVLIGLYAACLVGLATVNGRRLVRALSSMQDDEEKDRQRDAGTSTRSTSGVPPSSP